MVLEDRSITCAECGQPFTFSKDDQQYHQEKGYTDPKRCPDCRQARRSQRNRSPYEGAAERQMYPVTCAQCGNEAQVPFLPSGDRAVYCDNCFRQRRSESGAGSRPY